MVKKSAGAGKRLKFPKFGAVLDRLESFAEYGLDAEMFLCRRAYYGECQEVRILHASTYLHGAWPEVQRIIQYMNGEGFFVEYRRYAGREFRREWMSADVLLLGCDSKEWRRVAEALTETGRGLLGVWGGWDVLWYFADGRVPRDARLHRNGSVPCRNDWFSAEGIRMVRTHARRRFDVVARRGLLVTLELSIADGIDRLVAPTPRYDDFGRKVNRLKYAKKRIKGGGRDWRLFFAAVEFLMEVRNRSSHPNVDSSFDERMKAYEEFKKVAIGHGFDFSAYAKHGCPPDTDSQFRQASMRAVVALTGMANAWLDECDRDGIWAPPAYRILTDAVTYESLRMPHPRPAASGPAQPPAFAGLQQDYLGYGKPAPAQPLALVVRLPRVLGYVILER